MELRVIQTNDNGAFDAPIITDFEYIYREVTYRVKIEQNLKRKLLIGTDEKVECIELFRLEAFLEQLLFLFDGRFYPIESVAMFDENEDPTIYQSKVYQYFNNRLPIYSSIDLCRNQFMKLVDYKDVNFEAIIIEWSRISDELDIAFNMFLYCLSDIHMLIVTILITSSLTVLEYSYCPPDNVNALFFLSILNSNDILLSPCEELIFAKNRQHQFITQKVEGCCSILLP